MKVILKKSMNNLGLSGDVVKVAEGYARNYLIPKGIAIRANEKNLKELEHYKKIIQNNLEKEKKEAQNLADKLSNHSCTIAKKVGEEEKLFGSVTTADIEEALNKDGFNVSKKDIVIPEPIKTLGVYTIKVKVYPEIEADLKTWVVEA
jgi:large subunit ribosomal protein L9